MQKISPFLWFENQAEPAAKLYVSIFKDGKITGTMPGPGGIPLTVSFTLFGQKFTALNGGPQFKFNESISFVVDCDTQEEVDEYWSKLTTDGGEESMCGWLKDKYGVSWQIIPKALFKFLGDKDPGRAQRATQAMLKMRKIDIQKLQDAADGK